MNHYKVFKPNLVPDLAASTAASMGPVDYYSMGHGSGSGSGRDSLPAIGHGNLPPASKTYPLQVGLI